MKSVYIADDGKQFRSIEDCLKYEEELNEQKRKKEKLEKEREDREKEILDAYMKYDELKTKYMKDYGYPIVSDWLDFLFS